MTFSAVDWIAFGVAAVALIGVYLNVNGDRRCFWIWLFTNGFHTGYSAYHQAWPLALLFAVYWILAVQGIVKWRQKPLRFK